MTALKNEREITFNLSDEQIESLARPLIGILEYFYKDPENEKKFQKWLQDKDDIDI